MSWRDRLQSASFRGIEFKVSSSDVSGGRRIQETERWQKRTITADQGPILNKFKVKAYVLQNVDNDFDYFKERNDLIDALQNKSEVGTLIHPFFGKIKVHAGAYSISESFSNGGIAEFDIEFMLEEEQLFPGPLADIKKVVDDSLITAHTVGIDNFLNQINTASGFLDRSAQDVIYGIQKIQQTINSITGILKSTITVVTGILSSSIEMVNSIMNTPADLYTTMQDACESFGYLLGMKGDTLTAGVVGKGSGDVYNPIILDGSSVPEELGTTTVTAIITAQDFDETDLALTMPEQEDNRTTLINAFKYMLLLYACKIISRIDFSSQNSMQDIIDLMADAFDDFLLRLGNETDIYTNDFYTQAEDLWFSLLKLLQERMKLLQKEIDYVVPNTTLSTLQLAYNLYADVLRDEEIFFRNFIEIKHPGFLPQSETIQVLEK